MLNTIFTGIALLAFLVLEYMLLYFIPHHIEIYKTLQAKLPQFTQTVIIASEYSREYWIIILPIAMVVIIATCIFAKGIGGVVSIVVPILYCLVFSSCIWICWMAAKYPIWEYEKYINKH
jgi:type II secretory pathway component PulF